MKMPTFYNAYKSIRKPIPPQGTVERPLKGAPYRRREKYKKDFQNEE